jgi:hypothetical protein
MDSGLDAATATARAFATYAVVPYLGILFCPGAIVMGSIGLVYAYREPLTASRNSAYASMAAGVLLLAIQLFLWWILYKAPEWARGF